MTHRSSRILSLIAAVLFATVLAAPAIARAIPSESLSWARTFAGPDDTLNYPYDPIPVGGAFNAVSFADASNGWAVGLRVDNAGQIPGTPSAFFAYTNDGGSTWTSGTVAAAGIYELNGVDALTSTNVWAVGNGGTIVHWNGISWSKITVPGWPASKAFRGVSFADALNGWAVGDGRGVVYTSDGGATWSIIATPGTTGVLNAVASRSANSALAVGDGGQIKALSGPSVTSRATIGNTLYGVSFADDNHVWVVGSDAGLFKSADGGATFTTAARTLPGGFTANQLTMRSIAFATPYEGMIVSTLQMVWRTSDAGASWTPERLVDRSTLDDYELRSVAFAGSASVPVTVGRYNGGFFPSSNREKTRAYRGSWVGIPAQPPFAPSGVSVADGGAPRPRVHVTWSDNSSDESGFVIERSVGSASGPWTTLDTLAPNATSYSDGTIGWTSTYYYRVQSFRGELNSDWAVSAPLVLDAVPPTTSSDVKSAYVASATITFSASDNAGGSGVSYTYSKIDGAGLLDGPSRLVTGLGSHTLEFWSVDAAGNTESHHTADFSVVDGISSFVITKTAGAGGSIYGPDTVSSGADASYSITPVAGHHVLDVVVDGSSVGATTSVEFHAVKANHTISATFDGNTFTVTSSNGTNGSISPLGASGPIAYGADSATYKITPASGSVISNVVVDGVSVGKISAYKFTGVQADHTIRATFMRVTALTITSNRTTSTGGQSVVFSGTISPNMKNGTHVIVEWIKSGAHSWTRLASYVDTFSSHHWSYTLSTRTRSHGTYFVRVRYAGGTTYLPCSSISRKIVIR